MTHPLRIAIVNDYEIVVRGVHATLEPYAGRIEVVELDSGTSVVSDVDVILYDTFGQPQADNVDVDRLRAGTDAKVVVFSWNVDGDLVQQALARGVSGVLSKSLTAEELVDALERVAAGEVVRPDGAETGDTYGRWPGDEHGLTARESEVLALICQGLSNEDIGQRAFIGINTVKTHIRKLYRKAGVQTRSQAVRWGLSHGFLPDITRDVLED